MRLLGLRRRRHRRSVRCPQLLRLWDRPLPRGRTGWSEASFLVCDLEMSGLDPRSCEVLSIGWVAVDGGEIDLSLAARVCLRPVSGVGDSATVHGLRDCDLGQGVDGAIALQRLLAALEGRVLVLHNAPLDLAFLDRLSRAATGAPLLMPVVDTMKLEARRRMRRRGLLEAGDLRLGNCRSRYGLPEHAGHDALEDALATAELLLAHCATAGRAGPTLRELLATD